MSSSNFVRRGAVGAIIAGVAWALSGVFAFVFPGEQAGPLGSTSAYLIESAHAIAEVGMLAWLVGLNARQSRSYGRLGVTGFWRPLSGPRLCLYLRCSYSSLETDLENPSSPQSSVRD